MPQQVAIDLDPEVTRRLGELPSAVTPSERQLAFHYMAQIWDGTGDVFENGPLLGGATRALAMGMTFNDSLSPESRLLTYDWFSFRAENPLDVTPGAFLQLMDEGRLTVEEIEAARDAGTFLPLFESLHRDEAYWPLVEPYVGYLPGHRDGLPNGGEEIFRAPEREFAIAFVDGCKSWYGTKHWFREVVSHLRPGADLLFQDFAHYTCFWIPMLVNTFRESFELIAYVDYTYVYRLRDVPSANEVEERFPDEPDGFDEATYAEAFTRYANDARVRGDAWGTMLPQMQCAAAYAYIGDKEKARRILDELLMKADFFQCRDYLKAARVSPTYTPEGRIEL